MSSKNKTGTYKWDGKSWVRTSNRTPSIASKTVYGFREGVYNNLSDKPVYVKSKSHMREILKQENLSQV